MTQKIHIASSRPIGERCRIWAESRLPPGAELTPDPEACDVFLSVLYAHLVSEQFIEGRRCYNFHPGILPQYRGAGAFSWCLINGDRQCGVTLHELETDIDSGPILDVKTFGVEAWDDAESLFNKGMEAIYSLFCRWWTRLSDPDWQGRGKPQDDVEARIYYRKDLQKQRDLTRFVRAFSFGDKEPAFYVDRQGVRHELRW
jgi:methionyl-tRNA formyltransferase